MGTFWTFVSLFLKVWNLYSVHLMCYKILYWPGAEKLLKRANTPYNVKIFIINNKLLIICYFSSLKLYEGFLGIPWSLLTFYFNRFKTTWWWIINDTIFLIWWIIPYKLPIFRHFSVSCILPFLLQWNQSELSTPASW